MIKELINKMSDIDIPNILYLTMIVDDNPYLQCANDADEGEEWKRYL